MTPTNKVSIAPLLVVSFIGTLGFGIVLPSLVYIVKMFHGSDFLYGALGATYSAFQFFGAPILGKLSDRYGRKRILFVSEIGSAIAWALFLVALRMPMTTLATFSTSITGAMVLTLPLVSIFIARAVDGLTAGDVSVANAYVADVTTPEERKADFGKMGVAGNLGFILGPALAGLLANTAFGLSLPVALALALSVLALVLIIWKLPESHPRPIKQTVDCGGIRKNVGHAPKEAYMFETKMTLQKAFAMPQIPLLIAIYFVFFLAFSLFVAAMPLYATESLHWSITETGIFFSTLSVVMVITEGPMLTWLNKRASAESLTIWGTLVVAIGYLCLLVHSPVLAYLAAVLYAIGNGLMWPSFLSLLADRAGADNQGYIQGIGNSAGSLASIAGLLIGGALFGVLDGQIFWLPAGLVFIVFIISLMLRKRSETLKPATAS